MFLNTPASHFDPYASRSSSRAERVEGASSRPRRRFFSNLTRSRPASPNRCSPYQELDHSTSRVNMSAFASLEQIPSYPSESSTRPTSRNSRFLNSEIRTEKQSTTLARSLLHKSSRLLQKRKSSARLKAIAAWEDDGVDPLHPVEGTNRLTKQNRNNDSQESFLKHCISGPFNFQHVTHTGPNHARALQCTNNGDLMTEFCAIRAAQRPKTELKGIKADDLPSGQSSEVVSLAAQSTYHTPATSRPTTPGREKALQPSKSVDNFAYISNRSFSSPVPPIIPPPRRSSRKPVPLANVFIGRPPPLVLDSPTLPAFPPASASTIISPVSQFISPTSTLSSPATDPSFHHSPVEIAQAVTTPDDTACEIVPRPSPTPVQNLDDVAEEDQEVTASGKDTTTSQPKTLRHTRSFPSVKHFSRSFVSCPFSPPSNLAGGPVTSDPILPVPGALSDDIPARIAGRYSMAPKSMHESWEDSVDYCYDYAMEADGMVMNDGTEDCAFGQSDSLQSVQAKKSMNSMSQPELTDSATSSACSVPGIITPYGAMPSPGPLTTPRDVDGSTMFPLSPSLLVPKEYSSRVTHEEQYHQKLSESEFKTPLTFCAPIDEMDMRHWSPRSSGGSRGLALSKSTSDDSLSTGQMRQRHSSSIGSIPDLVRGKTSREALPVNNGLSAFTTGVSDLQSTIDCLRGDLIRAAENMPDAQFAVIQPTLTPPPSRLAIRTRASSESAEQMLSMPPTPKMLPPQFSQRQRSNSAVQLHPPRQRGHRTSYSLFPGVTPRV